MKFIFHIVATSICGIISIAALLVLCMPILIAALIVQLIIGE